MDRNPPVGHERINQLFKNISLILSTLKVQREYYVTALNENTGKNIDKELHNS